MIKKVKKSVPGLRFPEFKEDWEKRIIRDNIREYRERVLSTTEIPVYTSSRKGLKPQIEYFADREVKNEGEYGVVPHGFFVYRHMSDDLTFKFNINETGDRIAVSKEYPIFTTTEKLNSKFLLYKLNYGNDFKKFAITQKKGGTRTRLYYKNLCTWKTSIPSIEEQEKIAKFLGECDRKLNLLRRKRELLETYKRGVMQKIFSQQIRFKKDDGSNFPDWEKKKLGELGKIISGLTYSPSDIRKKGLLVLRSSNIQNGRIVYDDCVFVDSVVNSNSLSQEDDILICVRNGSTNLIGKNALIPKNIPLSTHGAFMVVFRSSMNKFLFQLFQTDTYKRQVYQDLGARINSINSNRLRKYKFIIPCFQEQEKIANFLTAIDKKIEAMRRQIEGMEKFKQGLLQKMFV